MQGPRTPFTHSCMPMHPQPPVYVQQAAGLQTAVQTPLLQTSPEAQTLPQAPQSAVLVSRLTQVPAQLVSPVAQLAHLVTTPLQVTEEAVAEHDVVQLCVIVAPPVALQVEVQVTGSVVTASLASPTAVGSTSVGSVCATQAPPKMPTALARRAMTLNVFMRMNLLSNRSTCRRPDCFVAWR